MSMLLPVFLGAAILMPPPLPSLSPLFYFSLHLGLGLTGHNARQRQQLRWYPRHQKLKPTR
jgi:hypothetical protein